MALIHFVDRQKELGELNALLQEAHRLAQLLLVHGRRRVGKTRLLLHWAKQSGLPFVYWMARRETPEAARLGLSRALWQWSQAGSDEETQASEPPRFVDWDSLFEWMARLIGDQPTILIFDEFSYAVESDPALPSHLQYAWDHLLKAKPIVLVLSGSHISMMVDLLNHHAPLYGRFTAQLHLGPLPYGALAGFFPSYSAVERVATYAVLGGIPAYLERFDPDQSLSDNIQQHLFRRVGMFRSEPTLLVSDLVREPRTYEAILQAAANRCHTVSEIARFTGATASSLTPYINRLREMKLIERRLSATVPPAERQAAKRGRYYIMDSYLRFYYRFVEPNLELIELGRTQLLWERMSDQFRAFIGMTAFEELSRDWILAQAQAGRLPFSPEIVGNHWSVQAQVDVVAINWREKAILLGECKWGADRVRRHVIRELAAKTPCVVPDKDWQVHYLFFARGGFTPAAQAEAEAMGARLVDLRTLDADLCALNPAVPASL